MLTVRCIVCILLIFAISGMNLKQYADVTTTIFAIDLSASTQEQRQKAEQFMNEAQKTKQQSDHVGVISFGKKAVVEQNPAKEPYFSQPQSYVDESATDIANVLRLSSAILPEDTRKRIVLLTDGEETMEDAMLETKLLKEQNIVVDAYVLQEENKEEVQLTQLNVPEFLNKNVQYDIEIKINSSVNTSSNLKLYKGNQLIINQVVDVQQGENQFVFSDTSDTGGAITYKAEIEPQIDTILENNTAYAYCYVDDIPSLLVVQKENSANEIQKILQGAKVNVKVVDAKEAPTAFDTLSAYDGVILANVDAESLPQEFLDLLENYVKNLGGGIITTGGENAYALGGYQNTPLETILPVEMQLKTDGEMPNLGMVLVIDRSGSMSSNDYGLPRIEMAKEAALRSLNTLNETDYLGVLKFDDKASWAVDLQPVAGNEQQIQNGIATIQAGGGTSILPALKEACTKLKDVDTKSKHMILLTDGQAEQTGYDSVVNNMKQNGITLSTVAVGTDADVSLLQNLARYGGGRFYLVDEFTDLPQIFAKETFLAGKEYINNRTFYPKQQDTSPILSGIESVAQLDGYIASVPKSRADILLKSDTDDPILATWQYGLGRTAAWTSDMNGQWSGEWLASEQGQDIFRNMISWVLRSRVAKEVHIDAEPMEEKSTVKVEMPYDETISNINASIFSSDNTSYDMELKPTAPGVYEGILDTNEQGAYIVNLDMEKTNGEKEILRSGFDIAYAQEYEIKEHGQGKNLLTRMTDSTGGKILTSPEQVFQTQAQDVYIQKEISDLLLLLALFIFLIDIALRRFLFILEYIQTKTVVLCHNLGEKIDFYKRKDKQEKILSKQASQIKNEKMIQKEQASENNTKNTASLLAQKKKKRENK